MFVTVRIELTEARNDTSTRRKFWSEFSRLTDRASGDDFPERDLERTLQDLFGHELEVLINDESSFYREPYSIRDRIFGGWRSWASRPVKIRVRHISYGSCDLILEILGLGGNEIRDGLLDALEIFSPIAFNEALDTNLNLNARIETSSIPPQGNTKQATGNKAWLIANTSLIVPCVLALAIFYFAFNALVEESKGLRSESQALRVERSEIVKALTDQNAKISTAIVDHAKTAVTSARTLEELQLNLIKLRAISLGLLPADSTVKSATETK